MVVAMKVEVRLAVRVAVRGVQGILSMRDRISKSTPWTMALCECRTMIRT